MDEVPAGRQDVLLRVAAGVGRVAAVVGRVASGGSHRSLQLVGLVVQGRLSGSYVVLENNAGVVVLCLLLGYTPVALKFPSIE